MPLISFRSELVSPTAFIAPGAAILGNVTIGSRSSVWYNAVLRGDTEAIVLGEETNVQDLCCLHADPGFPCVLGNRVTIGHGAIVHGATIEDDVLIGMRAVVMNGAVVGARSIIGVGAVVLEGMIIPPGSIVLGIPGTVKRSTTPVDEERIRHAAQHYVAAAGKCLAD